MSLEPSPSSWGSLLRDILAWSNQLVEVMCAPPAGGSGLGRGARRVHPPMPGGAALALRVRASDGSDPASIVRDWGMKLRRALRDPIPLHRTLETELAYMISNRTDLTQASWASACWEDLRGVWLRLGEVTGQTQEASAEAPQRQPRLLADRVPDSARVTLAEAEQFWTGVSGRVRTARSRDRARRARRSYVPDPEAGPAQPDSNGRYLVADLRRWHLPEPSPGV